MSNVPTALLSAPASRTIGYMDHSLWLAVAGGIAIAAACGLRAFLPLLLLGIASRAGVLTLGAPADWLSHDLALWTLGIAAAVEIIGDKVPVVDHALDAAGLVVRPLAGGLGAYAALAQWPAPLPFVFALVAGTGALGVQALKAKTRVGSTLLTAGAGNPILSFAEDVGAFGLTALAIVVPAIALLLVIAGAFAMRAIWRRLRGRRAVAP
ncbi:MAG: DUF4126 domain-containing protein [Acidobacteriota bacterium]